MILYFLLKLCAFAYFQLFLFFLNIANAFGVKSEQRGDET